MNSDLTQINYKVTMETVGEYIIFYYKNMKRHLTSHLVQKTVLWHSKYFLNAPLEKE